MSFDLFIFHKKNCFAFCQNSNKTSGLKSRTVPGLCVKLVQDVIIIAILAVLVVMAVLLDVQVDAKQAVKQNVMPA